jgi:hypothetical protein
VHNQVPLDRADPLVGLDPAEIDERGFRFRHRLVGHPALQLRNLASTIASLPAEDVYCSSGKLEEGDDLDRAHIDHPSRLSVEHAIAEIKTSNSYVMVRSPEKHPAFRELHSELFRSVSALLLGPKSTAKLQDPRLYLFIASPGSVTPFHIDRYSTLLLQLLGTKEVGVFPPWDTRVVSAEATESYILKRGARPSWDAVDQSLATRWSFAPGDGLHIPFAAGHYVKNGPDEPSVSMSLIFKTPEVSRKIRALEFNSRLRRIARSAGINLEPIGKHVRRDRLKASLYSAAATAVKWMR